MAKISVTATWPKGKHVMERMTGIEGYAALDFEASSLSSDSWPIEVGVSWLEFGEVRTWSSLIRPTPDWNLADWSPQSALVHGIALDALREAPTASAVAVDLLARLAGRRPVSDAPEFDARWLSRLLQAGGYGSAPELEDYDQVSFAQFSGPALNGLYETLERHRAPHRAGPDSARLVRAWRSAMHY